MRSKAARIVALFGVLLLTGCGYLDAFQEPSRDRATDFAMEACEITEVDNPAPVGNRFERPNRGEGSWTFDDSVADLTELTNYWREVATAAAAAYQLDDQWNELSGATTFNFTHVSRVLSLRSNGVVINQAYRDDFWPESYEAGRQFNANLDKIDVICGGLLRNLAQQ